MYKIKPVDLEYTEGQWQVLDRFRRIIFTGTQRQCELLCIDEWLKRNKVKEIK